MTPLFLLAFAVAATAIITLCSAAALRAWSQWLDLKRLQQGTSMPSSLHRVEIVDLRQRIRRLESIADGEA